MKDITLTKLDAAERQLKTAIWMFFDGRDPIAVHTPACAAHQILADIGNKRGAGGFLKNPSIVRPEKLVQWRKLWLRKLGEAANFFKHADRDPTGKLTFKLGITEVFLLDASYILMSLLGELRLECFVFTYWFHLKYPGTLVDGPYKKLLFTGSENPDVKPSDLGFFRDLICFEDGHREIDGMPFTPRNPGVYGST